MRTDNILISIIVPIYNTEKYLADCIESIRNQTHKKIEIILVNDGSTDRSKEIIENFQKKDFRIKAFHRENAGVSATRNFGIDVATGEYICFSDADDKLESNYVDYLLHLAVDNGAEMSTTRNFHNSFRKLKNTNDKLEIQTPEEATCDLLHYKHMIGVYCKMIKRSFLNKNNIRFMPDIFIGEGFNFTMDCFQRINKLAIGHQSVYFYRRDNEASAMSHFNIRKVENAILAMHRMYDRLIIRSPKILRAWKFATWHTYSDMWIFMVRGNAKKQFPHLYKQYLQYTRQNAIYGLVAPICIREKIRALTLMCIPSIYPYLMEKRQAQLNKKERK